MIIPAIVKRIPTSSSGEKYSKPIFATAKEEPIKLVVIITKSEKINFFFKAMASLQVCMKQLLMRRLLYLTLLIKNYITLTRC